MIHPVISRNDKKRTVNMSMRLEEILQRYKALDEVYFVQVPSNRYLSTVMFSMYMGAYKELVVDVSDMNCTDRDYVGFCGVFRRLADKELTDIAPVGDDIEVFFPNDYIVEVFIGDIHYICRLSSDEFQSFCSKYNAFWID